MKIDLNDTIAAIATSYGDAGIGIVRISGPRALVIADKIFTAKNGQLPSSFKTYSMHYGWITKEQNTIDEVIISVMRAPKSFTCEDVVEISCHGGIVAQRAILDLVLDNEARLALPGEFTRRAFLNGRIDLSQAEAILDVTKAKTDRALIIGVEQLKGKLSLEINQIRNILLDVLTVLEANIDFPEEDIDAVQKSKIISKLNDAQNKLNCILTAAKQGKIYREGICTVICGKTNVGKSSLLNALLKEERSIVTPIAGTTRDIIEEIIDIKGIPIRIIDTAGLLKPRDLAEKAAIAKTKTSINSADLIILMFDGSRKLSKEDLGLIRKLKKKNVLAIINKVDLPKKIELSIIQKNFKHVIELSAKKIKNIVELENAIVEMIHKGELIIHESVYISNNRHIQELKKAQKLVAESIESFSDTLSIEFIAQNLKDSISYVDDLLGKNFSEDLLDKIFNQFCIGK